MYQNRLSLIRGLYLAEGFVKVINPACMIVGRIVSSKSAMKDVSKSIMDVT